MLISEIAFKRAREARVVCDAALAHQALHALARRVERLQRAAFQGSAMPPSTTEPRSRQWRVWGRRLRGYEAVESRHLDAEPRDPKSLHRHNR
jgi:hypothetical protein